jgi:hypothetical protein
MKRFLSIAVILATTATAHADGIQWTDTANPSIKSDCSAVPQTANVTLGGVQTAVTSVAHGIRQDNVLGVDKPGYCADVLVSNTEAYWAAWNEKSPTAQAIRQAVSGDGTTANPGMLMVISMSVVLQVPVPAAGTNGTTIEGTFIQALQQNTAQSAADYNAIPGTSTTALLNFFLNLSSLGGGTKGIFGTSIINVLIDGPTGGVYYQGPNGNFQGPAVGGTSNPAFIQDITAMWYGDTTDTNMVKEHSSFELNTLLGLPTIPDEEIQDIDLAPFARPFGGDQGPAQ